MIKEEYNMSFNSYKHMASNPVVMKPYQHELDRVPRQFSDYMNEQCTRFSEICKIYLEGMTLDDVRFMKPKDFINLVPDDQYRHKLLMTIMVRRYLFRPDEGETVYCRDKRCDVYDDTISSSDYYHNDHHGRTYACDKCSHVCTNAKCEHNCSDYAKIITKSK